MEESIEVGGGFVAQGFGKPVGVDGRDLREILRWLLLLLRRVGLRPVEFGGFDLMLGAWGRWR